MFLLRSGSEDAPQTDDPETQTEDHAEEVPVFTCDRRIYRKHAAAHETGSELLLSCSKNFHCQNLGPEPGPIHNEQL